VFAFVSEPPTVDDLVQRTHREMRVGVDAAADPTRSQFGKTMRGFYVVPPEGPPLPPRPMIVKAKVAIKLSCFLVRRMRAEASQRSECPEDPRSEIAAMQYLQEQPSAVDELVSDEWPCPYVLPLVMALEDDDFLYTVMPYCEGGELFQVAGDELLDLPVCFQYWCDMLKSLEYFRRFGFVHHDLSPENFMIHNGRCVAIDFGMSRLAPRDPQTGDYTPMHHTLGGAGKVRYLTPEYFAGDPYDGFAHDLYAVACTVYVMMTQTALWRHPSPNNKEFRFVAVDGNLSVWVSHFHIANMPTEVVNLLQQMLWYNPERRLHLPEVVEGVERLKQYYT